MQDNSEKSLVRMYVMDNPFYNRSIMCYLLVLETRKEFCITLEESAFGSDSILCLFLSFGSIDTDDNHFILNDVMTNSTIVLRKNDSDLIVDKGFLFMKDKCFSYEDEYDYFEYEHFLDIRKECKNKEKNEKRYLNKLSLDRVPLQLGDYCNQYIHVCLDKGFNYQIYFLIERYVAKIAEGKWEKIGNKLLLHDASLECDFVYLIESDFLYPIFAPNDLNETDRYSLGMMYPFIMR
ncbi:hypothetical protein DW083_04985 [Parabacteroides sp. AF48-14]|uniref:hypothetical protein n=1 Tax=Parabacteroides sp. AF48-14 TaxID=2292052 RepID=UPI000EFE64F7|nr:hypothetical protein [Parabacteroides sp. AF48-14]RHO73860.1 hypothetical protein DW083_04985 [Parabacteroides sp. AF48-14]